MICLTLCANRDCAAFLDRPPVPHLDRDTGEEVLLCSECTKFVLAHPGQRYAPLVKSQSKQEA